MRKIFSIIAYVSLLILVVGALNASAATLSIPDMSAESGASVQVPVIIDDATGIWGLSLEVTYNSSVLDCKTASAGEVMPAGWMVVPNAANGQLNVGVIPSTVEPATGGSGNLIMLHCNVLGQPGSQSQVCLTEWLLADKDVNVLAECSSQCDCGLFTVPGGCVPTGLPDNNCDGIDDDCDGTADDNYVPSSTSCGTGVCSSTGQRICQNGSTVNTCTPGSPTGTDNNCNGLDENCNGTNNDNYVPTPTTCGVGVCASTGQATCQTGAIVNTCTPGVPQTEGPNGSPTCSDGLDNDCDGATDLADSNCVALCEPTGPDTNCNGLDEDCDGTPDDGYVPTSTNCGVGVCASTGQLICENGSTVNTCQPGTQTETSEISCDDQLDNDCDGNTDCTDSDCIPVCAVTIAADVDIVPATLNIRNRGMFVTCYIELPSPYDVEDIEVSSIILKDGNTTVASALTSPVEIGDPDMNMVSDLMLKFDRETVVHYLVSAGKTFTMVQFTVHGLLTTGQSFEGKDKVRVINPPKKGPIVSPISQPKFPARK